MTDILRSEIVDVPGFWEMWGIHNGCRVTDVVTFYATTTARANEAARGLWAAFGSPGYCLQRKEETS